MLDVDALLAAIPGALPCGPYVEYEPVTELERMAAGRSEQRLGDTVVPAEEPDWFAVRDRAEELFRQTKDLRVAVLLTRALVRTEQIAGLAAGLAVVHGLLARYWDSVNPPLDSGEGDDPGLRINALAALGHNEGLVRDVRNALLANGPLGRVTVREALVALGKRQPLPGEAVRSLPEITAALSAAAAKDPDSGAAVRAGIEHLQGIQRLLLGKEDPRAVLDVTALADMLKSVAPLCGSAGGVAPGDLPKVEPAAAPPPGVPGEIRSREDAIRQLETICSFFERTEPGNPAPLFIRRAQRLLNKSFVDIIRELAPDSLNRIEDIAGIKKT